MKKKEKKKKLFKIIRYELYPFEILLTCGTTKEEILEHLDKNYGYKPSEKDQEHFNLTGNGKTIFCEGNQTILWMKEFSPVYSFDLATLAHEVFHCVHFLMDKIKITLSFDSDEAYAYAIGFVFRRAFEELRNGNRPKTP